MAPLNGDVENGDVEKELRREGEPANDTAEMGEYGNLVRYISTYKDGRRSSVVSSIGGYEEPKKKWYQFGKSKGAGGDGSFETPEDWLTTDMRQGLSAHDVESRRKKTGWNELTTEKENLFLKFLSYFQGPILYGKSQSPL
jgi:H+-transporting ATPase